ncbi:MAG TPA: radical SAM protein, partial [Candidatus Hydrogenedentes bacterium]|nr:radical SAM protein [Candidatus Hydrogenedentota bacterium]
MSDDFRVTVNPRERVKLIESRLDEVDRLAMPCRLCGRQCRADRGQGEGYCRSPELARGSIRWAAAVPHHGEEPMLVGSGGSGTIFFSGCSLLCGYCQNWQISHERDGQDTDPEVLAEVMLRLQRQGAENLNLVTPTHWMPGILRALRRSFEKGLNLPLVYNTNGYDSVELIQLLDGIVDIWLPDFKHWDPESSRYCARAANYPEVARQAIRIMWRQSGPLVVEKGRAVRGMIIRHLVLPEYLSGSYDFLLWLADEGMQSCCLSLMSQYAPHYRAVGDPKLGRPITEKEYYDVVDFAEKLGFEHVLVQEMSSSSHYVPDFRKEKPFDDRARVD